MKNTGLMLFLFFCSFSSYSFDKFDAVVCEATKDEVKRVECYRKAGASTECKNKEAVKELACYKETATELEKKEQEAKNRQAKEEAIKQAELDKKNEEQKVAKQAELEERNKKQLTDNSPPKSQKITYTPEELRNMVKGRNYPQQDTPSVKKRESIDYTACIIKIESIVAASKPNYPSETVESTDLIQIMLWTNDSVMIFTCSATNNELIVTSAPYL